jgi:hypothetical protein
MAENEQEAYLALIAAHDPEIRTLLDQGFAFVMNAFKVGGVPSGIKARYHFPSWGFLPKATERYIPEIT